MGTGPSLLGGILQGIGENKRLARQQEVDKEHEEYRGRLNTLQQIIGNLDPHSPTHNQDIANILKWSEHPYQEKDKKGKGANSKPKDGPGSDEHIGHMSTLIGGLNKVIHGIGRGAKAVGENIGPFYQGARQLVPLDQGEIARMIGSPESREQNAQNDEIRATKSRLETLQISADVIYGKETAENKAERTAFIREGITGKTSQPVRGIDVAPGHQVTNPVTGKVMSTNTPAPGTAKPESTTQVNDEALAAALGKKVSDLTPKEKAIARDVAARRAALGIGQKKPTTGTGTTQGLTPEEYEALADRRNTTGLAESFGNARTLSPQRLQYLKSVADNWMHNPDSKEALANYKAGTANLRQLKMSAGLIGATTTAFQGDIDLASKALTKVPLTAYKRYNTVRQFLDANLTDDPELGALSTATQSVRNRYAVIMNMGPKGSGGTSVNAQTHSDQLLDQSFGPKTFRAVLDQMKQEAQRAVDGLGSEIEKQKKELQGGGTKGSDTPEAGKKSYKGEDPLGYFNK